MAVTMASMLLGVLLLQVPSSTATPPATGPTTRPADAAALITRLADPDAGVRAGAEAQLAALGAAAINEIRQARDASTDPDVQLRLDALIVRFEDQEIIGSTKINMSYTNAPLRDVIDDFARQSKANFGFNIREFGNEPPRVTIDLRDASFWQAATALQQAANINLLPQGEEWRVMRAFGNPLVASNAIESGAFLIQPLMSSYQRNVAYTRNAVNNESFTFTMQVMCEPKIRLAAGPGQCRVTRAVDSNGNSIVGNSSSQVFGVGMNQGQIHIGMQLDYPEQPGRTIAELSGVLKFNMARRVETISVEDFTSSSKPVEKMIDATRLTVMPGEANPAQPSWVPVVLVVEQGDPIIFQRLVQTLRAIRMTDRDGNPMQMNQFTSNGNNGRVEFRVSFMPQGNMALTPPYKLTLEVPTSFREVEIPFTFRDLTMP